VNERLPPRYWPSRALPVRAFVPGRGRKPALDAQPPAYLAPEHWRDNEPYLWGVDLYNHGFAWEAHEAWEGPWRAAKDDETQATFLQGLIQCAAAQVKTSMNDGEAAARLLARGLSRLARVHARQGDRYMGLGLARYLSEQGGGEAAGPAKLWLGP
jgi:hypothetical protein